MKENRLLDCVAILFNGQNLDALEIQTEIRHPVWKVAQDLYMDLGSLGVIWVQSLQLSENPYWWLLSF